VTNSHACAPSQHPGPLLRHPPHPRRQRRYAASYCLHAPERHVPQIIPRLSTIERVHSLPFLPPPSPLSPLPCLPPLVYSIPFNSFVYSLPSLLQSSPRPSLTQHVLQRRLPIKAVNARCAPKHKQAHTPVCVASREEWSCVLLSLCLCVFLLCVYVCMCGCVFMWVCVSEYECVWMSLVGGVNECACGWVCECVWGFR
jgi:hypothetical protein